ncbi:MAG: aminopeptidase, partial [Cytophagaceae bacterium]
MVWNFSKITCYGSTLLVISSLTMSCSHRSLPAKSIMVETGVSQTLAKARKQQISQLAYALKFDIPAQKSQPILSTETITFSWTTSGQKEKAIQLDFKEERAHLQAVSANGTSIPIVFESEHLLISTAFLKPGKNTISIQFTAGNLSLNRNDEYLYTLLVPDRARTVFPCFDQPDLKATFQVSLTIPATWQAMTNAPVRDSLVVGDRKTVNFLTSDLIPTYLFSFVAGKFTPVTRTL